ncbi:hypothetical protein I4F81_001521 [Pyropia yezoensis]|uniref:Uncharacterized protein n=1 Tax=Pyropia yezoensis TaxID=2788 RepID=A0ACC3BM75_PYRYE|nr:hypothetical protein I4F81_001521 [Neopyropia yezoensis]
MAPSAVRQRRRPRRWPTAVAAAAVAVAVAVGVTAARAATMPGAPVASRPSSPHVARATVEHASGAVTDAVDDDGKGDQEEADSGGGGAAPADDAAPAADDPDGLAATPQTPPPPWVVSPEVATARKQLDVFSPAPGGGLFTSGAPTPIVTAGVTDAAFDADQPTVVDDVYTDRRTIHFSYANASAYTFPPPKLTITPADDGGAGRLLATVEDYVNEPSTRSGEMTLVYRCAAAPPATSGVVGWPPNASSTVVVTWAVRRDWSVSWAVGKVCGGGDGRRHPHLSWGVVTATAGDAPFVAVSDARRAEVAAATGATLPDGDATTYGASVHDSSTGLYLELAAPAVSQAFAMPAAVSSDDTKVTASIRGAPFGGVLATSRGRVLLHVLYSCAGPGGATLTVTIGVPPWAPLIGSIAKDCGGGIPAGVGVSTSSLVPALPAGTPVVAAGIPRTLFASVFAPPAGVHGAGPPPSAAAAAAATVPATVRSVSFVVTNDAAYAHAAHVARVTLGVNPPGLAVASIRYTALGRRGALNPAGEVLPPGTSKTLTVDVVCLGTGTATLEVGLVMAGEANVEWAVRKACTAPGARRGGGGGCSPRGGPCRRSSSWPSLPRGGGWPAAGGGGGGLPPAPWQPRGRGGGGRTVPRCCGHGIERGGGGFRWLGVPPTGQGWAASTRRGWVGGWGGGRG